MAWRGGAERGGAREQRLSRREERRGGTLPLAMSGLNRNYNVQAREKGVRGGEGAVSPSRPKEQP